MDLSLFRRALSRPEPQVTKNEKAAAEDKPAGQADLVTEKKEGEHEDASSEKNMNIENEIPTGEKTVAELVPTNPEDESAPAREAAAAIVHSEDDETSTVEKPAETNELAGNDAEGQAKAVEMTGPQESETVPVAAVEESQPADKTVEASSQGNTGETLAGMRNADNHKNKGSEANGAKSKLTVPAKSQSKTSLIPKSGRVETKPTTARKVPPQDIAKAKPAPGAKAASVGPKPAKVDMQPKSKPNPVAGSSRAALEGKRTGGAKEKSGGTSAVKAGPPNPRKESGTQNKAKSKSNIARRTVTQKPDGGTKRKDEEAQGNVEEGKIAGMDVLVQANVPEDTEAANEPGPVNLPPTESEVGIQGKNKPKPRTPKRGTTERKRNGAFRKPWQRQAISDEEKAMYEGLENSKESIPITEFDSMGLKTEVLKAILAYGLEKPAFCQQNVIVPIMNGRDLICQAQSGMGKTAAYCIAILQRIDTSVNQCQAMVLVPTRELAFQVHDVFTALGKEMGVKTVRCIGQTNKYSDNKKELVEDGAHIVVGTPGRLCHLLGDRKEIPESGIKMIKTFVMDEADKMVTDASYNYELHYILKQIPGTAQLVVMSATMPSAALEKFEAVMRSPLKYLVTNDQLTLDGIQQYYVNVGEEEHKLNTLMDLFPLLSTSRGITFTNTRKKASKVCSQMQDKGHAMSEMVGSMDQTQRDGTLKDFRDGRILSLIASDLVARGVDVQHVKLVINYDFPEKSEDYIHRIGRAGRYGRKGIAITFITDAEEDKLKLLEEFYHTKIPPMPTNVGDLMEMVQ